MTAETNTAPQPLAPLSADESAEMASLEAEMADNNGRNFSGSWKDHYWSNPQKQQRWAELDQRRSAAPAVASQTADATAPLDTDTVKSFAEFYRMDEGQAELAIARSNELDRAFGPGAGAVNEVITGLPDTLQTAMAQELGRVFVADRAVADRESVETFKATPHGKLLAEQWGSQTGRRLGLAMARVERFEAGLSDGDFKQWQFFWSRSLTPSQRAAILDKLTD